MNTGKYPYPRLDRKVFFGCFCSCRDLSALFLSVALLICGEPAAPGPGGNTERGVIQSNGLSRTYSLYLPRGYSAQPSLPMLLAFHGAGGTGAGFQQAIAIDQFADQYGFMVLYPDAAANTRGTWALGCAYCTWAECGRHR